MTFIHNFTSFCIHSILSRILLICSTSTFSATILKNCWIVFAFFYGKFTFLFRWKLVGGHISIFKWHSKLLCADCAVCISMDRKSADSRACTASSRTPPQQLFSLILARPAWLVRFHKAQKRKMGTEKNQHSSLFGMKVDQHRTRSKQRDVNTITIFSRPVNFVNLSSF